MARIGFHLRAERGEAVGALADVVERGCAESSRRGRGLRCIRSVTSSIEEALERLIDGEPGRGVRGSCASAASWKRRKSGHGLRGPASSDEDAGVEAVVEIGGEVGDLVGEVDELGFERRELVEEVFGELGVVGGGVVARVLDDAFADGEGEVEAAKGGVALFKPGDDAQGVEVVVEAEAVGAEALVEGFFAGVAEGRMADVVDQGESLGELGIEAEGGGQGAGDLGDFKGVGEAAAEVVAGRARRAGG